MSTFSKFIDGLIERYGTSHAVAELIGMSASAFSRGTHNEATLSVDNLLKLAEGTGESPTEVLRLAGKGELADRIERLYGPPRAPLSAQARALLALDPTVQRQLLQLVATLQRPRR